MHKDLQDMVFKDIDHYEREKGKRIKKYWKLAKRCTTDGQRVAFFNMYPEAFQLDDDPGEDYQNSISHYGCDEGLSDEQQEELEDLITTNYLNVPSKFKIYAFYYCIESGMANRNCEGWNVEDS